MLCICFWTQYTQYPHLYILRKCQRKIVDTNIFYLYTLIFHIHFQAHEYVDKFRSLITTVKQFHPNLMFLVRFNKKIDFMQR